MPNGKQVERARRPRALTARLPPIAELPAGTYRGTVETLRKINGKEGYVMTFRIGDQLLKARIMP